MFQVSSRDKIYLVLTIALNWCRGTELRTSTSFAPKKDAEVGAFN